MKKIVSGLLLLIMMTGCAGRAADPVMVHQYGDEKKTCASLLTEMQFTQSEISRLIPKTNKTGKNVALGIAGWFLIVPWFFMDLSHAEQEEVNAHRQRYNRLAMIAADKNCEEAPEQIPDFRDQKAFQAYQERQQEQAGVTKEMTLEEARAKVSELEAKKNVPQPK